MELFDHQKKILKKDPKITGLFLGTGAGKTATAVFLAKGKTLTVCPKTQFEDKNWPQEVAKWGLDTDLTVISKEVFRPNWNTISRYHTLIIDEAHRFLGVTPYVRWRKGQAIPKTSQLFEALYSYIQKNKPERIYLCTATIMRNPMTVWGAAYILGHKIDWYAFRTEYYIRLPTLREIWIAKTDDKTKIKLAKLVKKIGFVGRLEEFFDVPEQTWKTDYIELTAPQKTAIKRLPLDFPDPVVLTGKKHSVENGILNGNEFSGAQHFDNGKIEKILDYASESPRMVIFCKYRAQIDKIEATMKKEGYTVFTMTGDTKRRGELLKAAQAAEKGIFICQAQISEGWQLPSYPVMIFASRNYEWVHFEQGKGRIQRGDNLKKNLYIKLIVKDGVDEAIDRSLENKEDFNERLYSKV